MDIETIEYIKEEYRYPKRITLIDNFLDLLIPLVLILGTPIMFIIQGIKKDAILPLTLLSLAGLIMLFVITNKIKYNNKFQRVKTSQDADQNIVWIEENISNILKIRDGIVYEDVNCCEFYTKLSGFSWGEQITIICDGQDLLLNSKNVKTSFTASRDKKNINAIINALKKDRLIT